ncbi:MAG: tyrosinase family protein [Sphingomonadales bacterium]|nr:MAG: tyrosinase family protein [Sphingomonadales bacterium]
MAGLGRREILAMLAAIGAGGPAIALGLTGPVRERLPWSRFRDTPDHAAFVGAIRAMKANANAASADSWQFWANIHQSHCPHGKDYFLAWHRGYLFLFEAKLRELSGSATLRLPYWDYFTDPRLPGELLAGDAASNPLFEVRKGGDVAKALAYAAFASDVTGFERGISNCFEANVEAFHNNVHNLVGGRMATMQSPQDIIFWMHHANVDRLWSAWAEAGQGRQMPAAGQAYWGGRLEYAGGLGVARSDAMQTESLGYFYADRSLPMTAPAPPRAGAVRAPSSRPRDAEGMGRPRPRRRVLPPPTAVPPPPPVALAPPPAMDAAAPSAASPLIYMALLLGNEAAPIRMTIRQMVQAEHDHHAAPAEAGIVLDAVTLTELGREGGFFYKLYLDLGDTAPGQVPGEERLLGSVGAFQIAAALEHAQDGKARIELPAGDLLRRFARGRDPSDLGVVFARIDAAEAPQGPAIRIGEVGFVGEL